MAARRIQRILLVDSDELMLDLLKFTLKDTGCKLLAATDGQQAMQAVQQHRPDLIITELVLPVMDGLQLLRRLQDEYPSGPPVMVLTALDRPGIHDEVTALGVATLVYKPVGRSSLLRQVRKLLGKRRPARVAAAG